MNMPSRTMPSREIPRYLGHVGRIVLLAIGATILGCLLCAAFVAPVVMVVIGPLAICYGILVFRSKRYWSRLEVERKEESICAFAQALPAREHDIWVVRAV